MAKEIKGIQVANSFSLRKKDYLDDRQYFNTIADMKAFEKVPDGFVTFNKEDNKRYEFNSSNDEDTILGKWRLFNVSSTTTDSISNWVAGKDYVVGDVVKNDDKIYQCITVHTSTVFADDSNNWIKIVDSYIILTKDQYDFLNTNDLLEDKLYVVPDDN